MTGKVVYCGPSIKHVVKQYTVYEGEISPLLKEFTEEHPLAKALIVPVEDFAQFRIRVERPKTRENNIYRKLLSEL